MQISETLIDSRKAHAIVRLLAGDTLEKAAESAGVSLRTLKRWRSDDTFCQDLGRAWRVDFVRFNSST